MKPELAPTPRDLVLTDGTAQLLRFRAAPGVARRDARPILLVPSLINRWYILDLRAGFSVAEALVAAGFDTWVLDWGVPRDEDRFLSWDDVLARLARMARAVRRATGADRLGLLGYCMGGTLTAIHAALHPEQVAALVNLAGPIDFAQAGRLAEMTNPRFFDARAIADAGNVKPLQLQSAFSMLRPTMHLAKWVGLADRASDPAFVESFQALEAWSNDNIPFPAAAYVTYIEDLYQQNRLVSGTHAVAGRRVELGRIDCPVMTIGADRDTICPVPAAAALNDAVGTRDTTLLVVPGGHVGAVVGSRAQRELYPAMVAWFGRCLARQPATVHPTAAAEPAAPPAP